MKRTSTYIFNETEDVISYVQKGKQRIYKTKPGGDYIIYDKDKVVDTIAHYINTNRITKGEKVINSPQGYISYTFNYFVEKNDKKEKYIYRVKIKDDALEQNKKYMTRLDALVKGATAIRTVNNIKKIVAGFALTAGALAATWAWATHEEPTPTGSSDPVTGTLMSYDERMQKLGLTDTPTEEYNLADEYKLLQDEDGNYVAEEISTKQR